MKAGWLTFVSLASLAGLAGCVAEVEAPDDDYPDDLVDTSTASYAIDSHVTHAGVNSGEILGYLTGRSRGFSGEVAEKLARAARVRVEDMFK